MLCLNISQQIGWIGLQTTNAVTPAYLPPAKLHMSQQAAQLEMHQEAGVLEIDTTACRASRGMKTNLAFAQENAELGKQAALDATGQIAQEGAQMAAIETHGNAFANIAATKNAPDAPYVTLAPVDPPTITYTPKPVQIDVTPGKVDLSVDIGQVEGDYKPGSVDVSMRQYPSVKMWVTENRYDLSV